jgi:hypothetical protein
MTQFQYEKEHVCNSDCKHMTLIMTPVAGSNRGYTSKFCKRDGREIEGYYICKTKGLSYDDKS